MYGRVENTGRFVREVDKGFKVTHLEDTSEIVDLLNKHNAPKECFWTCDIIDPIPGFYRHKTIR